MIVLNIWTHRSTITMVIITAMVGDSRS